MTWSQMEYFSRALSFLDADLALLDLAIAHNPYAKANRIERLSRALRRQMRSAEFGEEQPVDARDGRRGGMTGEALEQQAGQISRMFGPIKRVTLSPEEFAARMRAKG
jgi:hypothetical protein